MAGIATVILDEGKGKAVVVLTGNSTEREQGEALAPALVETGRVIVIQLSVPSLSSATPVGEYALEAGRLLAERKVRQYSLIAFGRSALIGEYLALESPRQVRSLVLSSDGVSLPASPFQKISASLDRALPIGVPFRQKPVGFSVMGGLSRVRCPVLIVIGSRCSVEQCREIERICHRAPTVWCRHLKKYRDSSELLEVVSEFYQLPVRCPQKNLTKAG
jgi:hypothetical protein